MKRAPQISQEPAHTGIYRKNATAEGEHPDQAPASTPTVRKQSVWTGHAVQGTTLGLCYFGWPTFSSQLVQQHQITATSRIVHCELFLSATQKVQATITTGDAWRQRDVEIACGET